jgi:integrase
MKRKFSDKWCATAQRGEHWDLVLPAFGMRVGVRTRTWLVATRRPGQTHPVRLKIGTYPAMSLADARARARAIMAGGAPTTDITLISLVARFLEHGRTRTGRELRQNTAEQYRRNLARYAAPLCHKPIADIRRRDVSALLADIAAKSGAPTASLVRSMLSRVFGWAIETDRLEFNPVTGSPSYSIGKRDRVLSDAEIKMLWAATQDTSDYSMILRILLWCGCRRSEAGGMRWSELVDGRWEIPGARTKNHARLELPLAKQTRAALATWPRVVGREHVFGSRSVAGFNNWNNSKAALDQRLRFNRTFVIHDIRRSVETRMAKLGVSRDVRARILNHDIGPIAEAYDHHDYRIEKRDALQRWADQIEYIVR